MIPLQFWQEYSCGPKVALELLDLLQAHKVFGYEMKMSFRQRALRGTPRSETAHLTLHVPIMVSTLKRMRLDTWSFENPGTRTHTARLLGTMITNMQELASSLEERVSNDAADR